jgi:hypothetical protein
MTEPGNASSQPQPWLEGGARAAEVGHFRWIRTAVAAAIRLDGSPEAARLAALLRVVAEIQWAQARGDVGTARRRIAEAVRLLPKHMTVRDGDVVRAVLAPEPPKPGIPHWTWRAGCVVWREQGEFLRLLTQFAPGRMTPRDALVAAYVEILRWVLCDPWWPGSAHGGGVVIDRFDIVLRTRAVGLLRLTVPTAGAIAPSVLQGLGGASAVCGAALQELAASPLEPWSNRSTAADRVPVRCGRVRARERALQWLADQEMLAIP